MEPNYHTAAYVVKDLIQNYDLSIIDPTLVLNVNTPNVDYSNELEINITTIGSWGPRNPPGVEEDSENKISYWTTHRESFEEDNTKCDINSLKENKISISPIKPVFSLTQDVLNNFELKNYEYSEKSPTRKRDDLIEDKTEAYRETDKKGISDVRILEAMRDSPRHLF